MARDATARLYDVDANLTVLNKKIGTITFYAKRGCLVDLDQLHESIHATRLGDSTGMALHVLDVHTKGKATISGSRIELKIPGSSDYFVLLPDPNTRNAANTPWHRLRDSLQRGPRTITVSGRMEGWRGNFTKFLRKLPNKPRQIVVKSFQITK